MESSHRAGLNPDASSAEGVLGSPEIGSSVHMPGVVPLMMRKNRAHHKTDVFMRVVMGRLPMKYPLDRKNTQNICIVTGP